MDGVDILLARIKSHPEDFTVTTRSRTWINLYDHAMSGDILKADEILALQQAMKDARREMFTQRVLKVLAGESEQEEQSISIGSLKTGMSTGATTLGMAGLTGLSSYTVTGEPSVEFVQKLKDKLFGEASK